MTPSTEPLYLDAQTLLEDSFRLAAKVLASGFRPTFIVAVWRGGAPVGLAVQEYFAYHDAPTDHIAIRTSSYAGIDERRGVVVHGLSYLAKRLAFADKLLLVDDVFDTGHTMQALLDELRRRLRRNMPQDARIAVPYYKPTRNETALRPHYHLHETARWLNYPHEVRGLTKAQLKQQRPQIHAILEDLL